MARPPPGPPRDPALHAELETVLAAKGKNYAPRTHLRDAGQPRYVNRLVREASPYLLQHAHNPVDWWPWGDAALAEAARRDVPVFLSAGYATCHWCHVMEDESFDNEEVAELLNGNFLPVKLDREQRPDVDHIYITATSVQQGQAGWPNSVWALPDGSPFHTGTYFPRRQFMQVLSGVAGGWREKRKEIEAFARQFSARLREIAGRRAPAADLAELPDRAFTDLRRAYNPDHGGFSTGTQFPHEGYLLFLLDHWRREGGEEAREMARHSLDMMARGGLHDHVGGGFHRYSVDVGWRTPHFEKMLYNQALLMQCYTQLWQVTDDPSHARSVARCAEYVARDMTAEDGAFFAAEDADSLDAEGRREEGAFFVWSPRQAEDALGTDAAAAIRLLNLDAEPTVEAGPVAHLAPGATVDFGRLDPILERLRAARDARPRPLRDEKVIGGWNGLMIRALAEAGIALDRGEWVAMAERAAVAVFSRLETRGGLARLHAGGAALEAANLTDYAGFQSCFSGEGG
ncbi:MAG: thioredoxin domain-containing protein, partial [Paracoccaceae bacterium]